MKNSNSKGPTQPIPAQKPDSLYKPVRKAVFTPRSVFQSGFVLFETAIMAAFLLSGCQSSNGLRPADRLESAAASSRSSTLLHPAPEGSNSTSEALQAQIAAMEQAAADTVVDVSLLNPDQIRAAFHSLELCEEQLLAYGDSVYASNQSFITPDQLRLVRLLYHNFDHQTCVGEMIVNEKISTDIEEIFWELYSDGYPIDHIRIPAEYGQDDNAIMEADITRAQAFTTDENGQYQEHEHSLGLAVDLNSFYNPQVIVENDQITVLPPTAADYVDRENKRPYMMDENDLAVQVFNKHGFTWGGVWQERNDYQHFEKGFDHETGHIDPNLHYGTDE